MGCCMSLKKSSESMSTPPKSHYLSKSYSSHVNNTITSKSPPLVEEETVKEVLSVSETPNPKPKLSYPKLEEVKNGPNRASFMKIEEDKIEKKPPVNAPEEISEVSEICSLSESISTTTITEKREEEEEEEERSRVSGEVRLLRADKSQAKVLRKRSVSSFSAGRTEGRISPSKRSYPSPGRRNDNAVKPFSGREMDQRRRVSGKNGPNRDSGEGSDRRSKSPVKRTNAGTNRQGLTQSPSSRKNGRYNGRIPAKSPGNRRNPEQRKDGKRPMTNESLENPLVSLECFIFL